ARADKRPVHQRCVQPSTTGDESADGGADHVDPEEDEPAVRVLGKVDHRGDDARQNADCDGDHRTHGDRFPIHAVQGHSTSPKGSGRPSLPGLRMPFGSKVRFIATRTSNAGPRASRTKRARFRPTPWWWLNAPPRPSTARVAVSHTLT